MCGLPFAALDDDRDRGRQQGEPAGVVEVKVRDHDPGERRQVELLGDALPLLELDEAERVGAA